MHRHHKQRNEDELDRIAKVKIVNHPNLLKLKYPYPNLSKVIKELKDKGFISVNSICKLLNINKDKLSQLLNIESFDVLMEDRHSNKIKAEKLKGLIEKIRQINKESEHNQNINAHNKSEELLRRVYDESICELIVGSDLLLSILDSDVDHIRLHKLCTILNIGINHICKLFEYENIVIESNPNIKISCDILKHFILEEPVISIPFTSINALIGADLVINDVVGITVENKLADLSVKIQKIDNKIYTKSIVLNQFIRNEYIREYSKIRAVGICELCEKPAPFIDIFGVPFLESHHVILLSKGGKDSIDNVVALCPNCHKKIHNLNLDSDIKKLLDKLEIYANAFKTPFNN